MLYKKVLKPESLDLLKKIQSLDIFQDFYLAGGTALALLLGHRISIDLDLFSPIPFKTNIMQKFPAKFSTISIHNDSIEVIAEDTKVFFFRFAYPLYKEIKIEEGIRLADPIDIGLMKLLALQGRTTKKDIIDLYFIDQKVIKLEKLLEKFENHYPKESFNSYNSLKELFGVNSYEQEPTPRMFEKINFEHCQKVVQSKVAEHIKRQVLRVKVQEFRV